MMKTKAFTKKEKTIRIIAQAFYGNRTMTEIREEELDTFILGYVGTPVIPVTEKIDRTLVPVPNAENLVLVYNKYREEESLRERDRLKDEGIECKPLAVIPEMDIVLYSRCIVCRMNEEGAFESLEEGDCSKFMKYLMA